MGFFADFILIVELLSLSLSLVLLSKFRSEYFYFFILFIFCADLVELLSLFYRGKRMNTYWIYNVYTFFEFTSIAAIYYHLNNEMKSKSIIIYMSVVFYCIYFSSFYFTVIQNYTVIILPFFTVPFMFLYMRELLNSNKIINYKKELPFWITVGFLIYYIGSLPFFTLQYVVGLRDRVLFTLLASVVLVMHLTFIGGLLWSKPVQK